MMDLETFTWLLTDRGHEVTKLAEAGDLSDAAQLGVLSRLRRYATQEQAAAAYETAVLRKRALAKFPQAGQMFFTREALEQASGSLIAAYRARRYAGIAAAQVADLCCGIGGDTLALAMVAHICAVDIDPLRLLMAQTNAGKLGLADQITFRQLDLERDPPPPADAIFFDPARRQAGKRIFDIAGYQPPITLLSAWQHQYAAIGMKLAPGIADADLAWLGPAEIEFISVDHELKEAVLWLGSVAVPGKRATVIERDGAVHTLFLPSGEQQPSVLLQEPASILYEPDYAVIRAGLVQLIASQIGAAQIDREIAYLTSDQLIETPFARGWRILEWLPFNLKRLQARLRTLDAGPVTVKKRGSPLDTDLLARKLSGPGVRPLIVVLTFVMGKPAALICDSAPITNWALRHEVVGT